MNNIQNFVGNIIASNPAIANNPQAQNYINVIQSGDANRGQQIADNICKTYGVSRDEALNQAMQFFGIR